MKFNDIIFLILLVALLQSCGVIEKRRYSSGWNLNLNLGGGSDKGIQPKSKLKKNAVAKQKLASKTFFVSDSSILSPLNVYKVKHLDSGSTIMTHTEAIGLKSTPETDLSASFDSEKDHLNVDQLNQLELLHQSRFNFHVNEQPMRLRNEPMSIIAALAFVVMLFCLFGIFWMGILSSGLWLMAFISWFIGVMCTNQSERAFRKRGALYKNKALLKFDLWMMLLSTLGLFYYIYHLLNF